MRVFKRASSRVDLENVELPDNPATYGQMRLAQNYPYSIDSEDDLQGLGRIAVTRKYLTDAGSVARAEMTQSLFKGHVPSEAIRFC